MISTYICHPSMANNECSGPALAVYLAEWIKKQKRRKYSYRIIFIPETIGSITYLSLHKDDLKRHVIAGFNLSCVGDDRAYSMVETRYGDTLTDKVLENVLHFYAKEYQKYSFLSRGSDERQYNAPGVDLPVCSVCRTKYGSYPEYHTSLDNMSLISPKGFQGSFEVMAQCITALEYNEKYQVTCFCEPQLGKRGLYPTVSKKGQYDEVYKLTNLIAYADGKNDLIDISNRIQISVKEMLPNIELLLEKGLLKIAGSENKYLDTNNKFTKKINGIPYDKIMQQLDIEKGDILLVSSDIKMLILYCLRNGEEFNIQSFIDSIMESVGKEGTVLFPVYNWDFCKGIPFDYHKTMGKTGSLGTAALKRDDFKRTKHPIYSFAVWGKDQDFLYNKDYSSSFGKQSVFDYLYENNAKNLVIDINVGSCFTFGHYVEEMSGLVTYRYKKKFTADYIDEYGNKEKKTYEMFVRNLDLDVQNVELQEKDFLEEGIGKLTLINNSRYFLFDFMSAYDMVLRDIKYNRSRKLCKYKGQ